MKKIRIGMVGVGFIAPWHLRGFSDHPDAAITGLCRDYYGTPSEQARQRQRFQQSCREWNLRAYESFAQMVSDPQIDALIIGSLTEFGRKTA